MERDTVYINIDQELLDEIYYLIENDNQEILKNILFDLEAADIALILTYIEDVHKQNYIYSLVPEQKRPEVFLKTSIDVKKKLIPYLKQEELIYILEELETDDAVDLLLELPKDIQKVLLQSITEERRNILTKLLGYEEDTAGGIMSADLLSVKENDTVKRALSKLKKMIREGYDIHNTFVVDDEGRLIGVVSIYELLVHSENKRIKKIMRKPEFIITPDMDQEEIAQIFKKYDVYSLPVVDVQGKLIGRITVDDIVEVMEEEHNEDIAKMVGTDAEEMYNRSPVKIALMRAPWVLMTLAVEFIGGIVIHHYDDVLQKIILLASFMPIISAISGNTGLQSAAVIIRALATGHAKLEEWWKPIIRQLTVTLILGSLLGIVIGFIGGIWHQTVKFGVVVGISMFIAVNLSGFVGTVTPMISKRFGIDPAITAGPFETAFQDVVGITIFLTLAKIFFEYF
ncbi:MAG: magnesium transporter [Leptospiraceae bacterium]|nr:magnesium transporter [Leptospiraceae bacterium]MDW7976034.1 magnesium transporter [Leptospiraceae bacterium]